MKMETTEAFTWKHFLDFDHEEERILFHTKGTHENELESKQFESFIL